MALRKNMLKGGLAALMMMVMTVGAYAWTASATASVNVRSGPGTNFRVVDVLQRGQQVDVEYCRSGWCFIDQGRYGANGWVSGNYLSQGYQQPRPPVYQPPVQRPPHWNPYPPRPPHWQPSPRPPQNSQVCFNGPNGYFCVGS